MDLLDELKKVVDRLEAEKIEYALCGGLALAVYALPRATLDIDIMIEQDSLEATKRAVFELGFTASAPPMQFGDGRIHIHRVSKIEPDTGEILPLDLIVVTPAVEQVWQGREKVEWEGGVLGVVSIQGLISLKSLRGSGQDQDDIERLRRTLDED